MTSVTHTIDSAVAPGHIGLGDADRRVGFAYTMTAMFGNLTGDPRPRAVLDALEGCLRAR